MNKEEYLYFLNHDVSAKTKSINTYIKMLDNDYKKTGNIEKNNMINELKLLKETLNLISENIDNVIKTLE